MFLNMFFFLFGWTKVHTFAIKFYPPLMKKAKARRLPRGAAYFFRWKKRKLLYMLMASIFIMD